MGMISKLICEKELPIPWDDFSNKENKIFSKIEWSETDFYTSSFFDYESGPFDLSVYTISEDGQFYKNSINVILAQDEEGNPKREERDMGIEKQDFTGEVYFGTEMLEKDHDYTMTFKALFYKGELKELDLEEWVKLDNKKRKEALSKITNELKNEEEKRKSILYLLSLPLRKLVYFTIFLIKWLMFKIYPQLVRLEDWSTK